MTEVFEGVAGAKFFAVKEATYGTGVIPAAADAIRHTSIRNAENRELVPLDEAGQGRSRPKAAIGRSSVGVEISTLWRPASAAGNPPEIDKLLENLFGTGAALAGSDMGYEYTLAADQVASIGCYYETNVAQEYWGGIALNELTLSLGGPRLLAGRLPGPGPASGEVHALHGGGGPALGGLPRRRQRHQHRRCCCRAGHGGRRR